MKYHSLQKIHKKLFTALFILLLASVSTLSVAEENAFASASSMLSAKKFKEKEIAIEAVMQSAKTKEDNVRVLNLLQALLAGKLYYKKSDKTIVITNKVDGEYLITDVISSEKLGAISKRKLKKITVNNKLRRKLRSYISQLSLENDDPDVRLSAIQNMMGAATAEHVKDISEKLITEKNSSVKEAMQTLIALIEMDSENKEVRVAALNNLSGSLEPKALNKIIGLIEKDDAGNYLEEDKDILYAAIKAKRKIDERRDTYAFFEKIFFGLSLGSVLLLAAIGLAITFGVMGVINMAHGELIMIGAYTTYVVQLLMPNYIEYSLLVAIPAAFIVSGLFGIAIERGVIRFLYGRPLETLLATFGISLILQQLVRSIFSPLNRSVETPLWMSGALEINPVFAITYNRLAIIIFSLIVFALLILILKKTSLGLKVRAVSQNRAMARAMGIRSEWVDAMTFGLGSGIAGIAGVALSQLTNVGPNLGQSYIIDSFLVVVFGGVGNLWGTLVAAMSLGVFNKFLEPVAGAVLAKILILVFIILFIQKKPRGLFPQKGRAAEN